MTRAPQLRVRLQLGRLASLERIYQHSHLTVAEARELFRLRANIARRRAVRAWLARGDNAERNAEYARRWREANPGCF
jgi:DNA mismatch repair ATPase MutS